MKSILTKAGSIMLLILFAFSTWAQDGKKLDVDVDVNKGGDWYTQPWVWIVGGAVFILLLVALLRSGKKE
jgi:hypothetical protein